MWPFIGISDDPRSRVAGLSKQAVASQIDARDVSRVTDNDYSIYAKLKRRQACFGNS